MNITKVIEQLSKKDRSYLMFMFEQGLSAFVKFEENKIIGIHYNGYPKIKIIEQKNVWYIGELDESSSIRTQEEGG